MYLDIYINNLSEYLYMRLKCLYKSLRKKITRERRKKRETREMREEQIISHMNYLGIYVNESSDI